MRTCCAHSYSPRGRCPEECVLAYRPDVPAGDLEDAIAGEQGDDVGGPLGVINDALARLARWRCAWLGDDITAMPLTASLIDQANDACPRR